MERGVYFDAWFPRQHCYHPSLPARRLKMVEDLAEYRATALVWSALGGGSLALPYLEQEAYGKIDPRFRFYGFVNDSEFIQECQRRAIKVFGIVFEVQGWEFPAELSEDEGAILALNELRGAGKPAWLGLTEFTQNRYPKLWLPLEHYFPGGLKDSAGQPVTDLIAECCSRDIHGEPCHAQWVECPDRQHQCYMMDRNNPVWREYLKAIIRIQVDAGVDGVQLDEAELPITSFFYGGCFCKSCMGGFRDYLKALPPESRPAELAGEDLDAFHYGEWLLARGYDFKANREDTPLFWDYLRFQQGAITRYFGELADFARQYAAERGRKVLVSGNFFNLFDHYYPLEPKVDLIITEMRNTRYRQPEWYRYIAGFASGKPLIVVENPYGGVVPELVEKLKRGTGYDLFRMSLYEAAALGANMSVPYGAWMGSVIQDAFYAPHDLCVEIQNFLADHAALFGSHTWSEVAVIYSVESNTQLVARRDLFADNRDNRSGSQVVPFWQVCEALTSAAQPYDVIFFPEGQLRRDTLQAYDLGQYRTIILPDCRYLTTSQAAVLESYAASGGNLLILGEAGLNLPQETRQELLEKSPRGPQAFVWTDLSWLAGRLDGGLQVHLDHPVNLAINIQRLAGGGYDQAAAMHIIRYDYDPVSDRVPPLPELTVEIRLRFQFTSLEIFTPASRQDPSANLEADLTLVEAGELRPDSLPGFIHRLRLRNVPLYCVLVLKPV